MQENLRRTRRAATKICLRLCKAFLRDAGSQTGYLEKSLLKKKNENVQNTANCLRISLKEKKIEQKTGRNKRKQPTGLLSQNCKLFGKTIDNFSDLHYTECTTDNNTWDVQEWGILCIANME